jgi:hypothetical protein
MTHDRTKVQARVSHEQCVGNVDQHGILHPFVGYVVGPFQFDPHGKIVAVDAPSPARLAGVPGAFVERYILADGAGTIDEQVCGDPDPRKVAKLRDPAAVEGVGEQLIDQPVTELPRRQADAVYDQQ